MSPQSRQSFLAVFLLATAMCTQAERDAESEPKPMMSLTPGERYFPTQLLETRDKDWHFSCKHVCYFRAKNIPRETRITSPGGKGDGNGYSSIFAEEYLNEGTHTYFSLNFFKNRHCDWDESWKTCQQKKCFYWFPDYSDRFSFRYWDYKPDGYENECDSMLVDAAAKLGVALSPQAGEPHMAAERVEFGRAWQATDDVYVYADFGADPKFIKGDIRAAGEPYGGPDDSFTDPSLEIRPAQSKDPRQGDVYMDPESFATLASFQLDDLSPSGWTARMKKLLQGRFKDLRLQVTPSAV